MDKDKKKNQDIFQSLSTPLAALSLFYAVLLEIVFSGYIAPTFWKFALIFGLLLFTFFFSITVYGQSQQGNELMRIAGFFVLGLWFLVTFYLQNTVNEGVKLLFSSFTSFGLSWLMIPTIFLIPIFSILFASRLYKKKKNLKQKLIYFIFALIIVISSYFLFIRYNVVFPLIGPIISSIPIGWLQILIAGILIGLTTSLLVAPLISPLNDFVRFIFNWVDEKIKKTPPKMQKP